MNAPEKRDDRTQDDINAYTLKQIEWNNQSWGDINDCKHCKGRGYMFKATYSKYNPTMLREIAYECPVCKAFPSQKKYFEKSGIKKELDRQTFDTFTTPDEATKKLKSQVQAWLAQSKSPFIYIHGSNGTGKTHISMAALNDLGKSSNFQVFLWKRDMSDLKAIKNTPEYTQRVRKYRETPVLYIDDLLKTTHGGDPSKADFETIQDILEERYNKERTTIISSEHSAYDLAMMDPALAGRIVERAGDFVIKAEGKNQRGRR